MVMQLGTALSFVELRRQALAEDPIRQLPVAATITPRMRQVAAMLDHNQRDSIIQPGIDEALARQDMLMPAPAQPSPVARLIARLVAAVCATSRCGTAGDQPAVPAAPHVTR